MSPLAVIAGLVGIGFGTLNAANLYWLPSISPLFSSLITIIGLGIFTLVLGKDVHSTHFLETGGIILAVTTLAGALLQWIVQIIAQWKNGLGTLKLRFDWRIPGVIDVLRVMIPATLSSGMLLINTSTDMFFAASIDGAAAAMSYSNFLVLTPLGIISNMILVPLFPVFSRLSSREDWPKLKIKIREGLFLSALTMLPLTAIFLSLALPIVQTIYQRGAFDREASNVVVPVLMAYGFGMFFYLARDVLLRVFYALGDGKIPAKISVINILLNFGADFFLVIPFKTPGLILATVTVNIISMLAFILILNRRLEGLPLKIWSILILKLLAITVVSSLLAWEFDQFLRDHFVSHNQFFHVFELIIGSLIVLISFFGLAWQLNLPELKIIFQTIERKFFKKKNQNQSN
jgi:putative peptidoglycan lipid II flippase